MKFRETEIQCEDRFKLNARIFYPTSSAVNKTLIINSATAVAQDLYVNYAQFMANHGFQVITYDYRGIASSRPKKLRGFQTSFTLWGTHDVTAVFNYAKSTFPNSPLYVMGHSIGGTLLGMTPKIHTVEKAVTVGAQTAYYKDWGKGKYKLYFLWHIFFPLMTNIVGYFPGKKLGLLEDVPKGVVNQWHARRKSPNMVNQLKWNGINTYFDKFEGELLTFAISDDPIGTETALRRIHDLYTSAKKDWITVRPVDVDSAEIGHFGFFRRRFERSLWDRTLEWFNES